MNVRPGEVIVLIDALTVVLSETQGIHSVMQAIYIAPLKVHYYSGALPTQKYCEDSIFGLKDLLLCFSFFLGRFVHPMAPFAPWFCSLLQLAVILIHYLVHYHHSQSSSCLLPPFFRQFSC